MKNLISLLLLFSALSSFSQSPIFDSVRVKTKIKSLTVDTDLVLEGFGTGLVNIEGAYTLPGADGTNGYLISTNGSGVWGYTDPSSLQVTFGTDNQVPFVNAGGTDFDYSANLTFDGTTATINSITLTTDLTVANGGTGASSFTDGGILYGNGTSAFSVTSAPAGADEFLVSTGAATWGLESASSARTSLGLGTMATETATNYVPFTGAASSVNLNTQSLTAGAGSFTTVNASGNLIVGDGVSDEIITVNGGAGSGRDIRFQSAGSNRWFVRVNNTAESGSNAGSNFEILARDDAGAALFTPLSIIRSTGAATFSGSLSAGATTTTTMRNSSNAGTGNDIPYYDSDGDLTRSTIDIADVSTTVTGTFTPVIADASSGGNTGTATTIQGEYTKTGKMVTVTISFVNINTAGMTGGNDVKIRDLPFTIANNTNGPVGSVILANVAFSGYVSVLGGNGTTIMSLRESASGASGTNVTVADLTSGSADILCSITYTTSD